MIIVPAVTCIMALSLTRIAADRSQVDRIALLVASWVIPVGLEQVACSHRPGRSMGDDRATSHVMRIGGNHTMAILIG